MKKLAITLKLDKLSVNGKAPLIYAIHGYEGRIIARVSSPYRLIPFDFIGKLERPTRRPLENGCIKEEIIQFYKLCEKHKHNPKLVIPEFRNYINARNEI